MIRSLAAAVLAVSLMALAPTAALAHGYVLGALKIGHPWSPPAPPGAPTAAGYLTLTNTGAAPDRFLGASSPAAAKVELHRMSMDGAAIMRMRPVVGGVVLPPGQTISFEPGGYHLMLIGPRQSFKVGDRIPATLMFERAGEVKVDFLVQAAPAAGEGHGAMTMPMSMH